MSNNGVLTSSTHIARRSHTCNYCHAPIEKGERYCRSVNKFDGELYTWKAHIHCDHVAQAIWDWVDPDEGMDEFTFQECSKQVMHDFFCKGNCNQWDDEDGCMEGGWPHCLRKFSEYMNTHRLVQVRKSNGMRIWEMAKKEGETDASK